MSTFERNTGLGSAVAVLVLATALHAQTAKTTTEAGAVSVTTTDATGVVLYVEGNRLAVKMVPDGDVRVFNVSPTQQFLIDGQNKRVGDLKRGTVLTATVTTTTQPVTVRTTAVVNGTVWYASGNTVILTLENGENRSYTVPDSYRFVVEGKPASVRDLRQGMKVTGEKVTAQPTTEVSSTTIVKGIEF